MRILAKVQRFKCRECGETFLQPLSGMHSSMRMTERCANFIKGQSLMTTFVSVAEAVGCDEKTVRSLAGDHIATLEAAHAPRLPEWLGIDETQIDGKMRCVITDIGQHRPIEMLADRDKGTLTTWLHSFKERSHVKGVAIDMWRPYRDVARTIFPNVPVVIDKFHVVRMANYCMERVRIRLGKSQSKGERRVWMRSRALINKRPANLNEKQRLGLSMWLENDPEMAAAYQAKEAFYDMPTWGLMRDGELWALETPDFPTAANEHGSWPTPKARDWRSGGTDQSKVQARIDKRRNTGVIDLPDAAVHRLWQPGFSGLLNPCFSETLMEWPTGWTDCAPLGMDRFQEWLRRLGECSPRSNTHNA